MGPSISFCPSLISEVAGPGALACADFVDVGLVAGVAMYRNDQHLHAG